MTGKIITYVLLAAVSVAVFFAARRTMQMARLDFCSMTNNKLLFRIFLVIGIGPLLCIPEKSMAWCILVAMFILLIKVLQNLYDGVDRDGIFLAGRRYDFSRFEAYSMRRLEKTTEFRFYRGNRVRMMEYPNEEAEQVERLIASKGLKKQEFQEIAVRRK